VKRIQHIPDSGNAPDVAPDVDFAEESAERALRSVNAKLDKSLSVQYTVNELITAATDPAHLSMIYGGSC
jgi:serine-protein kinase ATM